MNTQILYLEFNWNFRANSSLPVAADGISGPNSILKLQAEELIIGTNQRHQRTFAKTARMNVVANAANVEEK